MAKFQWEVFHSEFPTFCQLWNKITLSLSISMIFASNSPCKSYENEQNPYFSDFECNFRLLGGVFHNCSKSKYHSIHQEKNCALVTDQFWICNFSVFLPSRHCPTVQSWCHWRGNNNVYWKQHRQAARRGKERGVRVTYLVAWLHGGSISSPNT